MRVGADDESGPMIFTGCVYDLLCVLCQSKEQRGQAHLSIKRLLPEHTHTHTDERKAMFPGFSCSTQHTHTHTFPYLHLHRNQASITNALSDYYLQSQILFHPENFILPSS